MSDDCESTAGDALRLLTVHDVARLWSVKVDWVYDQVQAGRLPAVRIGGQRTLRFRRADLESYLSEAASTASTGDNTRTGAHALRVASGSKRAV